MDTQTPHGYIPGQQGYMPTSDERTFAILSHILTLVAPILAPLLIYVIKKDESSYVAEHAKESLNFHITMAIAFFVSFILVFVLIGILLLIGLGIMSLIFVIIGTINASDNKIYRYPLNFRLIK